MTVLRAQALDAQGQPVAGRTAVLEPWTGNRYRSPYNGPSAVRGLVAVSGSDGWMSWTLPALQRRPGPRGSLWMVTGLEAQPVVLATQPSDTTTTGTRVGTVSPLGDLAPAQVNLDTLAEIAAELQGRLSDTALRAVFGSRGQTLLGRLNTSPTVPIVHPSPPTVTYDHSSALWNQQIVSPRAVTLLGIIGQLDPASWKTWTGYRAVGLDFYVTADAVEINWVTETANAEKTWLWIDNQPVTAAPVLPLATISGGDNAVHVTWGSVARHRVTFYVAGINAFTFIGTTATGAIEPAAHRPKIAFIGDSFFDSSGAISNPIDSAPFPTAVLLGAECIQAGWGGTGYGTANGFGDPARVAAVAALSPDLLVFSGSVNDDPVGLQAKVAAAFAAYATACPGVPCVVFGPQPTNAADTLSAGRQQQIAAVQAAALAAPNVIAFHDRVGTAAGIPAAWSSGATYNEGDLVTHLGSVWRWTNGGVAGNESSPRLSPRWSQVTWDYVGTGNVSATAADGSRDVFLFGDGVHPMPIAAQADAARMAGQILADLAA